MAAQAPITHFEPDPDRMAILKDCTEDYGFCESPTAEWPNNLLSKRTVVYGSGRVARTGDEVSHAVDPAELELGRRQASEVTPLMAGTDVGMGSQSSGRVCRVLHRRERRGGNTDSHHRGDDLGEVRQDALPAGDCQRGATRRGGGVVERRTGRPRRVGDRRVSYLAPWREMIEWFKGRTEFVDLAFVKIGDSNELLTVPETDWPPGTIMAGTVLPRLALGLTRGGSLIGLCGNCVQEPPEHLHPISNCCLCLHLMIEVVSYIYTNVLQGNPYLLVQSYKLGSARLLLCQCPRGREIHGMQLASNRILALVQDVRAVFFPDKM